MIGFFLKAKGSGSFSWSKGGWSEGDLWLAKQALAKSENKVAGWSANEALIDAIEGQFAKIKELKFDAAVADTPKYELNVHKSFVFSYTFDPVNKSAEIMRLELAKKIARCYNEMGDQVALALFECIGLFKVHYMSNALYTNSNNYLNVWIDL